MARYRTSCRVLDFVKHITDSFDLNRSNFFTPRVIVSWKQFQFLQSTMTSQQALMIPNSIEISINSGVIGRIAPISVTMVNTNQMGLPVRDSIRRRPCAER